MSTDVIVYVLTGLALVVVVLTRLRMGRGQGAGRVFVGTLLLNMHTGFGLLVAIVTWVLFLAVAEDTRWGPAGRHRRARRSGGSSPSADC